MKTYPISIVIPVYKNYQAFYKNLQKNKKFFNGCEVIIMNDYPPENISQPVLKIYPQAKVFNNKKNLGFAGNVNKGIKFAKRTYVFLMNSDVILDDASFKKTVDYFRMDKKIFAISFAQREKDGSFVGKNQMSWQKGMIYHQKADNLAFGETAWAEGGACIIDRGKFLKLGGFDPLYSPFYWEDIDLSYRAKKAGYKIIFDPQIKVNHHHESTIGKFFDRKIIIKIAFRNQLIFHWKNLTDKNLILNHLIHLPKYFFTAGFFDALLLLPKILKSRKKVVKLFKKSDRQILFI